VLNAMTVDVEDWYMTNGLDLAPETWHRYEDRIEANTARVLALLERYGAKATFFVLGCVAERHPRLVEAIARAGHQIGTHGYWHRLLTRMTHEDIVEDVLRSRALLEKLSGQRVDLFRAPSWSLGPPTYRVLLDLAREGFVCDSSVQPFRTPLSGVTGTPARPFHPVIDGRRLELVEFPSTVWNELGVGIPFAGGFYLRAMPYPLVRLLLRRVNRSAPGMVYVHPWEFDPEQPRLRASPLIRLAQYYRLEATAPKLERLLREFDFAPIGEVLKRLSVPDAPLPAS